MEIGNIQYSDLKKKALDRYFNRMNDMQRRAVFRIDGPLLILAGAGSGKTTVLIGRIENMIRFGRAYESEYIPSALSAEDTEALSTYAENGEGDMGRLASIIADRPVRPWNILAITFTNKAAGELRNRLEERLGSMAADVHASTFHSMCVRILRREIEATGYGRNFTIYDTDDSLRVIKDGIKACRLDEKFLPARSILTAISRSKDTLSTAEDMAKEAGHDYRVQSIAKVYAYYEKALREANALDFDDIIAVTVRLFQENPAVLEYYQDRFRYIMVDEYQDTNHAQYMLVGLLAGKYKNLCVVGDDDQSIYKFRGATIENILSFENQFDDALVIRLEQNYRSTQNILAAANGVIANNTARKGKNLWTSSGDGDKLRVIRTRDENDESRLIADSIMEHVKNGGRFSDNAVLYRMNAQSGTVEKAFAQRGMPYRIIGGLRFYERKEIKDMVAYLSILENHGDTLRLTRIINEPKRGIGASTIAAAQEIASVTGDTLYHVIRHAEEYAPLSRKSSSLMEFGRIMEDIAEYYEEHGLDGLLDEMLERTGYLRMLEAQGFEGVTRIENIMELKSNILRYSQEREDASLSGFLEEIALYTDLDNYDQNADAVVLMTIHSAKGLEFENVFIAGMEEGIFPGRSALMSPEEIEEERRLAYVAITRAKKVLTIISAERRMLFGTTMWGRPSRFTGEIPAEHVESNERPATPRKPQMKPLASAVQGGKSGRSIGISGAVKHEPTALMKNGDRVRHNVFGDGIILGTKPMGGDTLIEVEFDSAGMKKLMANFAKLEII